MTPEYTATVRYVERYTALKAQMDAAFDRWAAATPSTADAAATEYYALLQQMRDLTTRRQTD